MAYERVYSVWDYFDGILNGIADVGGAPHYFDAIWDAVEEEYSKQYKLYAVGPEFLRRSIRKNEIFRAWALRFHNGEVDVKTHPGLDGQDPEWAEIEVWIKGHLGELEALPQLYTPKFRRLPGQDGVPWGLLVFGAEWAVVE